MRRGRIVALGALGVLLLAGAGCVGLLDSPGEALNETQQDDPPQATEEADPDPSAIQDLRPDAVHVSAPEELTAWPDASLEATGEIRLASGSGNVHLSVEAPLTWQATITPNVTELDAEDATSFLLEVHVPSTAPPRSTHTVDVTIETLDGEKHLEEIPITVTVTDARVSLAEHHYASPGGKVAMPGTLHVSAQAPGLDARIDAPDGWNTTARVEDSQEGQARFTVWAQIPGNAQENNTHDVSIEFTDQQGNPAATATTTVEVTQGRTATTLYTWETLHHEILIVPPAHGPIASLEHGVLSEGANGAMPGGAYLEATLHALEDWELALESVTDQAPYLSWLGELTWNITVVAEDELTSEDIEQATIAKVYTESTGLILGAGISTQGGFYPDCVAYSSMWTFYGSLGYEEMYKLAGHELGHCLGAGHTQDDTADVDIMTQGGYPIHELRCPSNLNMHTLAAAYAGAVDEETPLDPEEPYVMPLPAYEQYCSKE